MKLKIIHKTVYQYELSVFFEPHYLRFKPKINFHCLLHNFNLKIIPKPTGINEQSDAEDNLMHFCWFHGLHKNLEITSESHIETYDFNPFSFIIYPFEFSNLPFNYSEKQKYLLDTYLKPYKISNDLINYGLDLKYKSNFNTIDFLQNLTKKIHSDFEVQIRKKGFPHDPDKTFKLKKGSCRDLAWMQIHLLRYMGIASRFVSGYYCEFGKSKFELHAWLEVFLPGAGWLGFDPSYGGITGPFHIIVARSANFENTMPVIGSIRGDSKSKLRTKLSIEII